MFRHSWSYPPSNQILRKVASEIKKKRMTAATHRPHRCQYVRHRLVVPQQSGVRFSSQVESAWDCHTESCWAKMAEAATETGWWRANTYWLLFPPYFYHVTILFISRDNHHLQAYYVASTRCGVSKHSVGPPQSKSSSFWCEKLSPITT